MFGLTAISLIAAVATGAAWIGQPLRLVHLLTILGLGMSVGVTWAHAVMRLKASRDGATTPSIS
jgi:hypothetical protein